MIGAPILVVGVTQRSGTNFLSDLLCCHEATTPPRDPYREDFAFPHALELAAWADEIGARLPPRWGDSRWVPEEIREALGRGLADFLGRVGASEGRPVVKTPFAEALDGLRALSADVDVVVVVRDAPAVVASMVNGFGTPAEVAAHMWRDGARRVLAWRESQQRAAIVRYEDLVDDREAALTPVLAALGLDPAHMDWTAAQALTVRGSSFARGGLDWSTGSTDGPPDRPDVSAPRRARIDGVAGRERAALGYAPVGGRRLADAALDLVWPARHAATKAGLHLRRRLLDVKRATR